MKLHIAQFRVILRRANSTPMYIVVYLRDVFHIHVMSFDISPHVFLWVYKGLAHFRNDTSGGIQYLFSSKYLFAFIISTYFPLADCDPLPPLAFLSIIPMFGELRRTYILFAACRAFVNFVIFCTSFLMIIRLGNAWRVEEVLETCDTRCG